LIDSLIDSRTTLFGTARPCLPSRFVADLSPLI